MLEVIESNPRLLLRDPDSRDIIETIRLPPGSLPPNNHQYENKDNDGTAVFRTELRQDLSFFEIWGRWDSLVPAAYGDPCHDMIPIAGVLVSCRLVRYHEAHITIPDAIRAAVREAFPPCDKDHGRSAECSHARKVTKSQAASAERFHESAARGDLAPGDTQAEVPPVGTADLGPTNADPGEMLPEDGDSIAFGDDPEPQGRTRDQMWTQDEEVSDVNWDEFLHLDGESAETS